MTYNQFKRIRIIMAAVMAMIVSFAINLQSWIFATIAVLLAVLLSMIVIFSAKKQVKDVLADERDYYIAGKAARYALSAFCVLGAILSFYFMVINKSANAEAIGSVLAYSVCGLMLLNSVIVIYFQRNEK